MHTCSGKFENNSWIKAVFEIMFNCSTQQEQNPIVKYFSKCRSVIKMFPYGSGHVYISDLNMFENRHNFLMHWYLWAHFQAVVLIIITKPCMPGDLAVFRTFEIIWVLRFKFSEYQGELWVAFLLPLFFIYHFKNILVTTELPNESGCFGCYRHAWVKGSCTY